MESTQGALRIRLILGKFIIKEVTQDVIGQNSTKTTLPCSSALVNGGELSHVVARARAHKSERDFPDAIKLNCTDPIVMAAARRKWRRLRLISSNIDPLHRIPPVSLLGFDHCGESLQANAFVLNHKGIAGKFVRIVWGFRRPSEECVVPFNQ